MTERTKQLVIVRGGGDIATGTIHKPCRHGHPVLVLESGYPLTIRRYVAFSEAVYDGTFEVKGITRIRASGYDEACTIMGQGAVPVMIDENCGVLEKVQPWALVDAILAKKGLGTTRDMADKTIGLGPSFAAGQDVDLVIETMRGHNLRCIIGNGSAVPNIEVLGVTGGYGAERVIHLPVKGIFFDKALIRDIVERGQAIGVIVTGQGEVTAEASLTGLLRGIMKDGYLAMKGFEIADTDPRKNEYENRFTISDKARCIAGSVAKGLQMLGVKQGYWLESLYGTNHAFLFQDFCEGCVVAGMAAGNLRAASHLVQGVAYHFMGHSAGKQDQ